MVMPYVELLKHTVCHQITCCSCAEKNKDNHRCSSCRCFDRCKWWRPGSPCRKSEGVVRADGKHSWEGTLKIDLCRVGKVSSRTPLVVELSEQEMSCWPEDLRFWKWNHTKEPKRKNKNIIHNALLISILMSPEKTALHKNFDNFAATSIQWNDLLT